MKKLGSELIFISRIRRDGSGTVKCLQEDMDVFDDEQFELIPLSLSQKTWIASSMNCFVVKLKSK